MEKPLIVQLLLSFAPIIVAALLALAFGAFVLAIARRKGVSRLTCLQALVPLWNVFFLYWLASRTDAVVLSRLRALEREAGAGR